MRRSFDGLCLLVQSQLQQDPFSGHLFVFLNRRRDRVKLLYWCGDGFAIRYRRLEKGTFQLPSAGKDELRLEMKASDLSLILDGIELTSVRRRPRVRATRSGQGGTCRWRCFLLKVALGRNLTEEGLGRTISPMIPKPESLAEAHEEIYRLVGLLHRQQQKVARLKRTKELLRGCPRIWRSDWGWR